MVALYDDLPLLEPECDVEGGLVRAQRLVQPAQLRLQLPEGRQARAGEERGAARRARRSCLGVQRVHEGLHLHQRPLDRPVRKAKLSINLFLTVLIGTDIFGYGEHG